MATGNFDVLSEGFGNLGAALSGVGGIEGKRQQLLQEMRAKAEMEQLLKQAELKQQAEALASWLAHSTVSHRTPCGDFNTPRRE